MKDILIKAYDAETFRKDGHKLIDLLADYLQQAKEKSIPVIDWKTPQEQLAFWKDYNIRGDGVNDLFSDILERSNHMHHPGYVGHQVAPALPLTALADLLGALVSNGMAVYEVGPAASAIEKCVMDVFLEKTGFDSGDGYLTSGGTLANLTALLAARRALPDQNIWETGHSGKLAVMVSDQAHYCIERALRIMGFGAEGVMRVPVNDQYSMRTELLPKMLEESRKRGIRIMAVAGSAPSTATGMHDDLQAIGTFCHQNNIWFHVDAAHGGGALFSDKYRQLLSGIHMADSVVVDGHKMMLIPVIATALLFKDKKHASRTFSQQASYLLDEKMADQWENISAKTFECTKHMMAIKFYAAMKAYGLDIFNQHVTSAYDLGKAFAAMIRSRQDFELFIEPESNIVCFRYTGSGIQESELNRLNTEIRTRLMHEGRFYMVQTRLENKTWLRTSLMNPLTGPAELEELLGEIARAGSSL